MDVEKGGDIIISFFSPSFRFLLLLHLNNNTREKTSSSFTPIFH